MPIFEGRELTIAPLKMPPWHPPTALSDAEIATLEDAARDKTVLELGAQWGGSTVILARVARHVLSVDWHKGDPYAGWQNTWETYLDNLRRAEVMNVTPMRCRFADIVPALLPSDLAFLDGDHAAASVRTDLLLVREKASHVLIHDYGRYGVAEGIRQAGATAHILAETLAEVVW